MLSSSTTASSAATRLLARRAAGVSSSRYALTTSSVLQQVHMNMMTKPRTPVTSPPSRIQQSLHPHLFSAPPPGHRVFVRATSTSSPAPPPRPLQHEKHESASATPAEQGVGVVQPPSAETLKTLFISSAVPMIGFGFMDNMVMIQAGDLIDNTIGVKFGLATLTAAACGQVFSDVSGVCFGGVVDAICAKLGLPTADLSTAQRQLPIVKRVATGGSVVGVVVGCCLGMLSLLFMDLEAAERAKKQQELDTIFKTVIREGSETLNAERCSLFVVDPDTREVWTRAATGVKAIIKVGVDDSLVGFAVKEKKILNVKNAYEHPKFNKTHDVETGFRTQSILCVPVFGEVAGGGAEDQDQNQNQLQNQKGLGEVVAVVQVVNRMRENRKEIDVNGFDEQDERAARMLARHVGIFLAQVGGD